MKIKTVFIALGIIASFTTTQLLCPPKATKNIMVTLRGNEQIKITKTQLDGLKKISRTISDMIEDMAGIELTELPLPSVSKTAFDFILKNLEQLTNPALLESEKKGYGKRFITMLSKKPLTDIVQLLNGANFLEIKSLVDNAKDAAIIGMDQFDLTQFDTEAAFKNIIQNIPFILEAHLMGDIIKSYEKSHPLLNAVITYNNLVLDFSPNGKYIAVYNEGIYDTTHIMPWPMVHQLKENELVSWSPDNKYCAISNKVSKTISIYEIATWTQREEQSGVDPVWSSNGNYYSYYKDGYHFMYDTTKDPWYQVATLEASSDSVLLWNPNPNILAFIFSSKGTWGISRISSGSLITISASATHLDWSPNGKYVVAEGILGNASGLKWIYEYTLGKGLRKISLKGIDISFSPNDKFCAVYNNGEWVIYDTTVTPLPVVQRIPANEPLKKEWNMIGWSPDSKYVAINNNSIVYSTSWQYTKIIKPLPGHIRWSPDNKYVAFDNANASGSNKTYTIFDRTHDDWPAIIKIPENRTEKYRVIYNTTDKAYMIFGEFGQRTPFNKINSKDVGLQWSPDSKYFRTNNVDNTLHATVKIIRPEDYPAMSIQNLLLMAYMSSKNINYNTLPNYLKSLFGTLPVHIQYGYGLPTQTLASPAVPSAAQQVTTKKRRLRVPEGWSEEQYLAAIASGQQIARYISEAEEEQPVSHPVEQQRILSPTLPVQQQPTTTTTIPKYQIPEPSSTTVTPTIKRKMYAVPEEYRSPEYPRKAALPGIKPYEPSQKPSETGIQYGPSMWGAQQQSTTPQPMSTTATTVSPESETESENDNAE